MNSIIKIGDVLDYLTQQGVVYQFQGDLSVDIEGFSSLGNYKGKTLTWIKKLDSIPNSEVLNDVTLAVVEDGVKLELPNMIMVKNSKKCFFDIIEHFFNHPVILPEVGAGTYISPSVKLGKNVKIGYNCVLDGDITVGDGTVIYHNVSIINKVKIGSDCVIQSGVVIGQDGFGYSEDEDHRKTMVRHYGGVIIGNNVHISANCNIARGTIDNTVIGDGSKFDALCHIAHNVEIGENVALIAGATIYGSVQIGDNAYVSGCIVKNQKKIGENALVGMGSIVIKDVEAGMVVAGNPAKPLVKK